MQYLQKGGYKISKLTLGTVALGLDYGISNAAGRPGENEAMAVISSALEAGINALDTARTYGDAERLIGTCLSENKNSGEPVPVVSKFKLSAGHLSDRDRVREEAYDSVRNSLAQLKLQRLPVCLFHMERSLPLGAVLKIIPPLLHDLKKDGLIDLGGVSADHPGEASHFLEFPEVEAIQVPMNIFDHRVIKSGTLEKLRERDKLVFVRSIFLQGLIFMQPGQLRGNLTGAAEHIRSLQKLAGEAGLSVAQLAFSFILDLEAVSSIVFGAVTPQQVAHNVDLLSGPRLSEEVRSSAYRLFGNIPEEIITPALWSKQ